MVTAGQKFEIRPCFVEGRYRFRFLDMCGTFQKERALIEGAGYGLRCSYDYAGPGLSITRTESHSFPIICLHFFSKLVTSNENLEDRF